MHGRVIAVVLPSSRPGISRVGATAPPALVWMCIERAPHHLVMEAMDEGTGRRVRLVLSFRAATTIATALYTLQKIDPAMEPGLMEFATKARIEVA